MDKDSTAIVAGANSGMGKVISFEIAKTGVKSVVNVVITTLFYFNV